MDGCESKHQAHKPGEVKTSATRNDAVASRRPKTRDVSSRYRSPSPSPSTLSSSRRCQSPPSRTVRLTSDSAPKRCKSAERKRPSSPPLKDSSVDIQISSGKVLSGRSPEGLWPSTMRRLSVSLQKEKPVTKVEVGTKSSSEKKRSPLVRKNASENCKAGGSVDLIDRMARSSLPPVSSRRMSLDGMVKPVKKTATDAARLPSAVDRVKIGLRSIDDNHLRVPRPKKLVPGKTSSPVSRGVSPSPARHSNTTRGISPTPARQSTSKRGISPSPSRGTSPTPARHSISTRGISPASTPSRGTSPAPAPARQSTPARGISPGPVISPTPSRGTSPTPPRPSTPSTSVSALGFIADFRNGKKSAANTNVEDAHQLRLLYNRYLQWKFANARAGVVLHTKEVIAEKTLYNVWNDTLALCETVALKRISLQQLRLELKLNSLLNEQIAFLEDWAILERDHISSLSGFLDDLKAGTLRLPITRGARVDTESLSLAVSSAVDVMQAMGSSIYSFLPRVEWMNSMVSELAFVALQEIEMLDHCQALLGSTAAVRVQEYSLRTHLIQKRQASNKKSHHCTAPGNQFLGGLNY